MPDKHVPQFTAGIAPEAFSDELWFARTRTVSLVILGIFLVIGICLRMNGLGSESLGEDELNKLQTVAEYRENGLSGKNGEHPFLMKGLQTVSVSLNEKLGLGAMEEGALRFPVALIGAFSALLLFLLTKELFGRSIGLVAGVLWCIEPMAIGFDRIAKEDSLALFFFLLTNLFWVKSQSKAERGENRWLRYVWLAGVAFAAMMASKYYPHLLGIIGAYYILFQALPSNRWALGRRRWLIFFIVMGGAFLVFNPTILFPDTWREMLKFSSEGRIGHDSYQYMGALYPHKMTNWLSGVPWTFYYVFIAVKTSLPVLVLFLIGLPLIFLRRLGDGRFLIWIWAFMWFLPYSVLGGKFTRYFTMAEPLILICAAVGFCIGVKWIGAKLEMDGLGFALQPVILFAVVAVSIANSVAAAPHYRLYTNSVGTYFASPGWYFPHDEIYDGATRETVASIASTAPQGATVASETPSLVEYYAAKAGRPDLQPVLLSDKSAVAEMKDGDFVLETAGRRYFSNSTILDRLSRSDATEIKMGEVWANRIYKLDGATAAEFKAIP